MFARPRGSMGSSDIDPLMGPSSSQRSDAEFDSKSRTQGQEGYARDPESLQQLPLVPGMSKAENMLRWGFIRKVYGIIACQMVLTSIIAAVIMTHEPLQRFCATNVPFGIAMFIFPIAGLLPLYLYQDRHPWNLALLGVWTTGLSVSVGVACSFYPTFVVLEALALTSLIVVSLTVYTFRAVRKGADFSFMGPFLFTSLMCLVAWSFMQFFFAPGPIAQTVFALFGAIVFSGYLIFDTHLLIEKFTYDQYIWASVTLYLDILNLFLKILQLLGSRNN